MIVSHDSGFLDNVCTDIIHYETRKLVHYRGNLSEFVKVGLRICVRVCVCVCVCVAGHGAAAQRSAGVAASGAARWYCLRRYCLRWWHPLAASGPAPTASRCCSMAWRRPAAARLGARLLSSARSPPRPTTHPPRRSSPRPAHTTSWPPPPCDSSEAGWLLAAQGGSSMGRPSLLRPCVARPALPPVHTSAAGGPRHRLRKHVHAAPPACAHPPGPPTTFPPPSPPPSPQVPGAGLPGRHPRQDAGHRQDVGGEGHRWYRTYCRCTRAHRGCRPSLPLLRLPCSCPLPALLCVTRPSHPCPPVPPHPLVLLSLPPVPGIFHLARYRQAPAHRRHPACQPGLPRGGAGRQRRRQVHNDQAAHRHGVAVRGCCPGVLPCPAAHTAVTEFCHLAMPPSSLCPSLPSSPSPRLPHPPPRPTPIRRRDAAG